MIQKALRTKEGWLGVGVNGEHIPGVETLAELWRWTALNKSLDNAFHYLHNGRWIAISTDEFDEMLRALAVALQARGLKPGSTMGIIASPSPWWLMMDLAVQSIGAISVPLFPNLSIESFDYQVKKSGTRYLFIDQDRELSDPIRERLSQFDRVIALRTSRSGYTPIFFYDLIDEGRKILKAEPKKFEEILPPTHPDDVATIIFTSGSSGIPKGVQLTHRNILSQVRGVWGRAAFRHQRDIALSGLPLAHSFERTVVYFYMSCGLQIYFADDTRRLGELLQSVRPHVLTVVPRLLEKVMEKMRANANASKPITKWMINNAIDYAMRKPPKIFTNAAPDSYISSPLHWFYDRVVFRKMRMALGDNFRLLICGGAKLAPQTHRFFLNIGLPVSEGYGLTEGSPVIAVNEPWDNTIGSVGYPLPGIEVKLDQERGLVLRGENVMKGYLDDPERTAKMIDSEGWLHTSDKATIDEQGRISIVGRLNELFKTTNGKYVSPTPIEQKFSEHPLIDMAMVVADGRKYPVALLFSSEDKLTEWQKCHSLPLLSMEEFWSQTESQEEIKKMIEQVNTSLSSWEKIYHWKVVTELPTIDNNGLTPTLKIRRATMEKRHAATIEALYEEKA